MHGWYLETGQESPYADWLSKVPEDHDIKVTTRVWSGDWIQVTREALLAHRTQVAPDGWWFKIPADVMKARHPWEEYQLARSLVGEGERDEEGFETDLFAGLR
jgi:mycothiol S-conjugate amidase